ncbi:hypothetical protein [Mycoplasmopsis bovigenitalium]|uniref:hypothetical protein n=1 Tax=Mycoplasmopsis bovigenitalium TaxID=2112 RepID=UPI000BBAAC03|nr:hypothetical protein [Mycoplasmopsis bovigenitalium]
MSKTKIILASTLSVLAVASVTTAAVVVTQKRKKQSDSPKNGNQVVVAADTKFEYDLNADQTKELTAKLLLVKGQDVTVTLTENNASKIITTKVKEDGTIDFSTLKDGKTYTVTKIVVKDGEKERDLIAEVKAPKEKPGNDVQPGGTAKPTDPTNRDGKKPGNAANPAEPIQGDDSSANGSADAGKGPETGKAPETGGEEAGSTDAGATGSQSSGTDGGAQADNAHAGKTETGATEADKGSEAGGADAGKQGQATDQTSAGNQGQAAGQASDNKQDQPSGQAGSISSQEGNTDKKEKETDVEKHINKWTIKKAEFSKNEGILIFHFETTNSEFNKIKDKQFEFKMESNRIQPTVFNFGTITWGGKNVQMAGISKTSTHTTFEMISQRQFVKQGGAPEGNWTLLSVYDKENPEKNLLQDVTRKIEVKYD